MPRNDPTLDLLSMWFQTPQVIASRLAMLATTPVHSARAQAEATRMVSEKMAAAAESMVAMQFAIGNEMMRMMLHPYSRPSVATGSRIVAKSIRPYGKRVRSNAKRLAR